MAFPLSLPWAQGKEKPNGIIVLAGEGRKHKKLMFGILPAEEMEKFSKSNRSGVENQNTCSVNREDFRQLNFNLDFSSESEFIEFLREG